jgi:type III secretion protein D
MSTTPTPLALRVLSGPRKGAGIALEPGGTVSIGYGVGNDVVIRDASLQGVKVALELEGRTARLNVLEGQVTLLGMPVGAGHSVVLPDRVPIALGNSMIAYGPRASEGWENCVRLAREMAAPGKAKPGAAGAAGQASAGRRRVLPARAPRWAARWAVPLAVVATAAGLAFALNLSTRRAPHLVDAWRDASALPILRDALAMEGFARLSVTEGPDGAPLVRGFLASEAERVRLSQVINGSGLKAAIDVRTGEQLARSVADVLRVNGIRASTRHVGQGTVAVLATEVDPKQLERAEAIARRDVPGLAGLVVESTPKPAPAPVVAPVREDPAKRVAQVVYGPNGYVATVDGARYFVGAILPTGHRIVDITQRDVLLDKDGSASRLAF